MFLNLNLHVLDRIMLQVQKETLQMPRAWITYNMQRTTSEAEKNNLHLYRAK